MGFHKDQVDNQQFAVTVISRQAVEITGIGYIGERMAGGVKDYAVGLHRMNVSHRRGEGNISDRVGLACFQYLDRIESVTQIA